MALVLLFFNVAQWLSPSAAALAAACAETAAVNVFVGSGGLAYGYGSVNPGAQLPLAPLRLGPDTTRGALDVSYRHFSGYHFQDDVVRAFSHSHLVGAGVNDLGTFGVMPLRRGARRPLRYAEWWSPFNKSTERAAPGTYAVRLDAPGADARLVAVGTLAAAHQYVFAPPTDRRTRPALVVDVCHSAKLEHSASPCVQASFRAGDDDLSFAAAVQFSGSLSGLRWHYLHAELRMPQLAQSPALRWEVCAADAGGALDCGLDAHNASSASGTLFAVADLPAAWAGDAQGAPLVVELFVGYSRISAEAAQANLLDALRGVDAPAELHFDALQRRTAQRWCEKLRTATFRAMPGDDDLQTLLYSALYRTFISVSDYTESGQLYLGFDQQLHNVSAERQQRYGSDATMPVESYSQRFFSDLSLWDTFRTYLPWLLLTDEELAAGVGRSMAEITAQQQAFPRWVLGNNEGSCMIGLSGAAFIVEAAEAGLLSAADVQTMQRYLQLQSTTPYPINGRADVEHYLSAGFVSAEASDKAASLTLTYAFDDFLLGRLSDLAQDAASAQAAYARSGNYRLLWSAEQRVFCPRSADGQLRCAREPTSLQAWQSYTEGNALHWAWFVPHDVAGLMQLYGSAEDYTQALEDFLQQHVAFQERLGSAVPNPYYWAGNEHDFLAPWMFSFGSDCRRTQYWTRRLTHLHFSATPHGIPGNEDYGSMATWLLFAALGLFPQAGLSRFVIGSPRVAQATLFLRRADATAPWPLRVVTHNNSAENVYVDKLLVDGQPWTQPVIERAALLRAKTLDFFMHSDQRSGLC